MQYFKFKSVRTGFETELLRKNDAQMAIA